MIVSLAGTVESELGSAMSSAISGVIDGTQTVQQAFGQMFKNIGKAFIDMATQMIAKWMVMKVLGMIGGGLTGGGSGPGLGLGDAAMFSPMPAFAEGGFVTGPTTALVGEGGEPEYIIPASKMGAAMQRYNAGSRGGGVIPGSGESGSGSETGSSSSIDVSYRVTEVNSVRYVDEATFQAGMRQAAEQGAAAGHRKVFGDLRNSRSQRQRVGLGR
jgi:hypothetical protein